MTPYHLHPHSSPEITTGTMALYREPMPNPKDYRKDSSLNRAKEDYKKWQSSFLAYIKEPGFKPEDDRSYYYKGQKECWIIDEDGETYEVQYVSDLSHSIVRKSNLSHYQEGQQIDPEKFKYVKLKEFSNQLTPDFSERTDAILAKDEWQEVKEPIEPILKNDPDYDDDMDGFEEAHLQFYNSCREGTILLGEKN